MNEAILESIASFQPWFSFVHPNPPSVDKSEEVVRQAAARFILREDLQLLLFEKSSGQLVGSSGLHRIDWRSGDSKLVLQDSEIGATKCIAKYS